MPFTKTHDSRLTTRDCLLVPFRLLRDAGRLFVHARAFDHAASISFFALLSVGPFLILIVSAVGYLVANVGPESRSVEGLIGDLVAAVQTFAPVGGDRIRRIVHGLIDRRGEFGLVGGLVMLLGASMVFGALEHAVEDIFAVRRHRRFLVSRALFVVIMVTLGFGLFVLHWAMTLLDSFFLAAHAMTFDEWIRESALLDAALTYLPVPVGFLAALYLPGVARVRLRHALASTVLFVILWESARTGYGFYATHIARFGVLYGSLATPLLLILWTFYSANILLFCFCCASVLGRRRPLAFPTTCD